MKPTDEQVNNVMGLALGWQVEEWPKTIKPDARKTFGLPDYCNDRNALPEVWTVIKENEMVETFLAYLRPLLSTTDYYTTFGPLTAEPRLHVIAALKALGQWPDDWNE